MILGCGRVLTDDQKIDSQLDALKAAGMEKIFTDKISATNRNRQELDHMLDQVREGDIVLVAKYDRLARSLRDLLDIVEIIESRGAGFRSLAEDIDTTTPAGKRISERTKEGLEAARARGRVGGRPHALTASQRTECSCPYSTGQSGG